MRPIIMRCELTSRLGRTRPAHVRSRGSETLLRIPSWAGYTIDTHESRFRKRQPWLEAECLEVARLTLGASEVQRVTIRRLHQKGTDPNWKVADINPQPTPLLSGEVRDALAHLMLGELDPVSGIARGEQGDKAKTSLAAFTNISFLHHVRNGTVE